MEICPEGVHLPVAQALSCESITQSDVHKAYATTLQDTAEERQDEVRPLATEQFTQWLGGDNADQTAVLLVAAEIVRLRADDLVPGHERGEADRRAVELHPDIGGPLLR